MTRQDCTEYYLGECEAVFKYGEPGMVWRTKSGRYRTIIGGEIISGRNPQEMAEKAGRIHLVNFIRHMLYVRDSVENLRITTPPTVIAYDIRVPVTPYRVVTIGEPRDESKYI